MSRFSCVALWAVLFLSAGSLRAADPVYEITDLTQLSGTSFAPTDINNSGVIVGNTPAEAFNYTRAVVWNASSGLLVLPTVGVASSGRAINNHGVVAGYDSGEAFTWSPSSGVVYFDDRGAGFGVTSINDAGTLAGTALYGGAIALTYNPDTGIKSLGTPGGSYSTGKAINNSGRVAGRARGVAQNEQVALWDPVTLWRELGSIGSGGDVHAMNDASVIVGAKTGNYWSGFMWSESTGLVTLNNLSGGSEGAAMDVNNSGQIVGCSYINGYGEKHAVIWQGSSALDLNALISPSRDWTLNSATAINDLGQIVGVGTFGSDPNLHAFLLTPMSVPEPGTLGMVACAALLLPRRRTLRRWRSANL